MFDVFSIIITFYYVWKTLFLSSLQFGACILEKEVNFNHSLEGTILELIKLTDCISSVSPVLAIPDLPAQSVVILCCPIGRCQMQLQECISFESPPQHCCESYGCWLHVPCDLKMSSRNVLISCLLYSIIVRQNSFSHSLYQKALIDVD